MFLGIIVVCGVTAADPTAVDGCTSFNALRLDRTQEECSQNMAVGLKEVQDFLASAGQFKAYITDMQCVPVSIGA